MYHYSKSGLQNTIYDMISLILNLRGLYIIYLLKKTPEKYNECQLLLCGIIGNFFVFFILKLLSKYSMSMYSFPIKGGRDVTFKRKQSIWSFASLLRFFFSYFLLPHRKVLRTNLIVASAVFLSDLNLSGNMKYFPTCYLY